MMKSFVFAATSIACIISISNIADANSRRVYQAQGYNLQAKESSSPSIPKSELKAINEMILRMYERYNKAGYAIEHAKNGKDDNFGAREVKELKLLYFRKNASIGMLRNIDLIGVEITEVERTYVFNGGFYGAVRRGNWSLKKEDKNVKKLEFVKEKSGWRIDPEQLLKNRL
jgi:opacity protein-like surface antigen